MSERKLDANGFPAVETRPEAKCQNCARGTQYYYADDSDDIHTRSCPDCNGTGRRTDRSSSSRRMG